MSDTASDSRWTLFQLPFSARVVLACFLLSVGIGYVSAIVQLHFQHSEPGSVLPSVANTRKIFHGEDSEPEARFVTLVLADEKAAWSGTGQMTAAFTTRSNGWKADIKKRVRQLTPRRVAATDQAAAQQPDQPDDEVLAKAEAEVRAERLGERDVLVDWVKNGYDKGVFDQDSYCLPTSMKGKPITKEYVEKDKDGVEIVKIKSIFTDRCVRCHTKEGGDDPKVASYPFDNFEETAKKYFKAEKVQPMSLTKLAQTTHVHLLSFSMLYGLTGLLLALSSLPAWIRLPLAPLPLLAQVIDISCWWLARIPGEWGILFADAIPITGAIVAVGLLLHLVLTLFSMFRLWGWVVLAALFATTLAGAQYAKVNVIDPYIQAEIEGKADR